MTTTALRIASTLALTAALACPGPSLLAQEAPPADSTGSSGLYGQVGLGFGESKPTDNPYGYGGEAGFVFFGALRTTGRIHLGTRAAVRSAFWAGGSTSLDVAALAGVSLVRGGPYRVSVGVGPAYLRLSGVDAPFTEESYSGLALGTQISLGRVLSSGRTLGLTGTGSWSGEARQVAIAFTFGFGGAE